MEDGCQRGALFAALRLSETELGRRWAALRPEARGRFPGLKPKQVADLHVTLVYLGHGWKEEQLLLLRERIRLELPQPVECSFTVARLGSKARIVGLDLVGLPETAGAALVAVKGRLAAEGLNRPEAQDGIFRPHATLAEVRGTPTRAQREALSAFTRWIGPALDLDSLRVELRPRGSLLLAGASRPQPGPDYIEVEAFLAGL